MNSDAFLSLATIHLPSPARLLLSSWCPDKDLLVLVTRLGTKDRLSLWKMQGAKKWEIGFDADSTSAKDEIVDIAWSPDRQTIAVAHSPPRITLHSIQDGAQERSLPISTPPRAMASRLPSHVATIWWVAHDKKEKKSSIPDIFKRGDIITGSALSILKGQPLLDSLQDDTQPLTVTDLFAFQGGNARAAATPLPSVISSWPALPPDSLSASIQPTKLGGTQPHPGEDIDEIDDSTTNSILFASDDTGYLHAFLDGSYPLGAISIGVDLSITTLFKDRDMLFAHPRWLGAAGPTMTSIRPFITQLPKLHHRTVRDAAKVSSSVRELIWYAMRVVKDMRSAWFGSETHNGARELGPKWLRALESRQKDEFGQEEPHAMLDLTCLLTTGRASDSLSDYLGSGEQMSERGLQKWESTIVEALVKLRDLSEKKVAPACQRLHILLEEVHGWSQLPQYESCNIDTLQVTACLGLASRAIILSGWLAAMTRRELVRFKEFMTWLKYETARANTSPDSTNHPPPKHDILEVNDYLMSGLVVSPIDKWFMGPVPQFTAHDLGVPEERQDLRAVIARARSALKDPQQTAWQSNIKHKDLSHLDRNLDSLMQELATRCQRIFIEAASATARSAVVLSSGTPSQAQGTTPLHATDFKDTPIMRERTVEDGSQAGTFVQYLAFQTPRDGDRSYLCLARMRHGLQPVSSPLQLNVAVVECCVAGGEGNDKMVPFDILDMDFFDENVLIVVYRVEGRYGSASIATVGYSDLIYETMELGKDVNDFAREALMLEVFQQLKDARRSSVPAPIIQSRTLAGCKEGKAFLAVNGRAGRRVACVLDGSGCVLEILDIEGEEEEAEMSTVEA